MFRHRNPRQALVQAAPLLAAVSGIAVIALASSTCLSATQASKPEWFRDVPPRTPADPLVGPAGTTAAVPEAGAPSAADPGAGPVTDVAAPAPATPLTPAPSAPPAAPSTAPPPVPPREDGRTQRPAGDSFFGGGNRSGLAFPGSYSDYPYVQMNAYVVAQARLATVRAMLRRAENELSIAFRNAQHEFETSAVFLDALREEKGAYDNLIASRRKALQSLATDQKYQRLAAFRADMAEQIACRRAAHDVSQDEIVAMATVKLNFAVEMRSIEAVVLQNDGGDLKAAQDKLVAAGSKVAALRAKYDESLRANQPIMNARQNLEDARIVKITAEAYLNGTELSGEQALDYAYYLHRRQGYNISADSWGWGAGRY